MYRLKEALNLVEHDLIISSQELLDLKVIRDTELNEDIWKLNSTENILTIDFEGFKNNLKVLEILNANDLEQYSLIFKILFITSITPYTSKGSIYSTFNGIYKTFYYLAVQKKNSISRQDIESYYRFMLMNTVVKGKLMQSYKPVGLKKSSHDLCRWNRILMVCGLPKLIDKNISEKLLQTKLSNIIPRLTNNTLTYLDWKIGGSFNTLSLDIGGYYIDHCVQFFEKNIELAIVLNIILNRGFEVIKNLFGDINLKNYMSPYRSEIIKVLQGGHPEDSKHYSVIRAKAIHDKITNIFFHEHHKLNKYKARFSIDSVNALAAFYNVNLNDFQAALIRNYIQLKLDQITTSSVLDRAILDIFPSIDAVMDFTEKYVQENSLESKVGIPDINFFLKIGCETKSQLNENYIDDFIRKVQSSGQIACLAFTGWRSSEMDFSKESFFADLNLDILDANSIPITYNIKHYAPKTHGKHKVKREVTHNLYSIIMLLSRLNLSAYKDPCLVTMGNQSYKNNLSVAEILKRSSGFLWQNFANFYPQFIELRSKLSLLNTNDVELDQLKWTPLYRAHEKIHIELELTNLTKIRNGLSTALKTNDLSEHAKDIIKSRVPKEYMQNILKQSLNSTHTEFSTKNLSKEITRSLIRPTPHAFRHMWAEAVYRRFDGDVGWAIRSNFKHISNNMWLAYVRNKDSQSQHQKTKSLVVSSLLKNYISKKGNGYAGAIDTTLRRLISQTKIIDIDELTFYSELYGNQEIEDIKSTPWGFCLLRSRHQSSAKCAEHGVPQRSKASPSLCLGCVNNLAMTSSIEGILLSTANDLKVIASKDERMPSSYKRASYKTVKLALSYLKKLNADKNVIQSYQKALKNQEK